MISEAFEQAVKNSKTLKSKPSNDVLLKLYSLYKQATEGDVNGERPGGFDFKGQAKYDSWESLKGKSKEDAAQEYIDLVNKLLSEQ
ncbi:MAG: acyl-CoA-binding protein [Bacteroidales bacterium]|nr:acyl-CoA-binding protein [Bacteroidales bacterium]